jgi:hypothetical protein
MAGKGHSLPIFGLGKAFDVGRGIKVFLNLQTGVTRGKVPEPLNQSLVNKKNRQIYRLKKQLKDQGEDLFQLRNKLSAMSELAGDSRETDEVSLAPGEEGGGALPDFVVIGTMRGGTTNFYGVLTKHPHIKRAAAKELHFFDKRERFERGIEWYRGCFPPPQRKDGQRTITGEASPMYLFHPKVPERMARAVPQTRLIVLLRNPVDRAYSHYHLQAGRGFRTGSFKETVEDELAWLNEGKNSLSAQEHRPEAGRGSRYDQLARGIYVDQLVRWRQFFDEEQMLVLKSEDFYRHTADTLKQVQHFLGLPYREIDLTPREASRKKRASYEPMTPATREQLEAFFEPHNRRLYDLLGRDFGW